VVWTDATFSCTLADADGNFVAQVVKDGSTRLWAAFDMARVNSTGTGPLRVAGRFPDAATAKAFVEKAIEGNKWQAQGEGGRRASHDPGEAA
jgi:hypothetical protein